MLEHLFGSTARAQIISYAIKHQEDLLDPEQMASELNLPAQRVKTEITSLTSLGLLMESPGPLKRWRVNQRFVLLPELKALMLKSVVLLGTAIAQALVKKVRGIRLLVLTGIFTNQESIGTDILLVGPVTKKSVSRQVEALAQQFNQPVRYTVMDTTEFRYRHSVTDKFVFGILNSQPVIVIDKLKR